MPGTSSLFRCFFCQKLERNVRFQTEFEQKPRIIQRQFSQNLTFFMRGTWSKCRFYSSIEKNQKVRFWTEIEQKSNIIQRQFSRNVTFFYERHILFFWVVFREKKNRTKVVILYI